MKSFIYSFYPLKNSKNIFIWLNINDTQDMVSDDMDNFSGWTWKIVLRKIIDEMMENKIKKN